MFTTASATWFATSRKKVSSASVNCPVIVLPSVTVPMLLPAKTSGAVHNERIPSS